MTGAISISRFINLVFHFYFILIIFRILLSWLPSIDWSAQPFAGIRSATDPFLNIFRGIIPPIGGMLDISPVLAIILLQIVQGLLVGMFANMGL